MRKRSEPTIICGICQQPKKAGEVVPAEMIRQPIVDQIKKAVPDWMPHGYVCLADINRFRAECIQSMIETQKGELSAIESDVLENLGKQEILAQDINKEFERQLTLGERLADKIAEFGGSWAFIITFAVLILLWITVNTVALLQKPFDPFPYILLNLILSCLAAVQAPIIMMSQNRQEAKDRLRAEHDYRVNLKAELEVRLLHEKVDYLLMHQWQRLLEIQQIQMELMEEIARRAPHES